MYLMKKNFHLSILYFFVLLQAAGQSQVINDSIKESLFNETGLLQHIKTLSSDAFEGRQTGTVGGIKAREYIIEQFQSLQFLPLTENYEQLFSLHKKGKVYKGSNILGCIKGTILPDTYIVISAHYDHEGIKNGLIYNGADDDASGVCALFSFAEYFKKYPPKHSVILAAFDAEELGLQGSKYFVNNSIIPLDKIMLDINMDMISRSDKNELFVVGTTYNDTLKNVILNLKQPQKIKLSIGHDGKDGLENWTYSSDQGSFQMKNIPFLYFGVEDHKDYHQPTDDYENIQPGFYIEAVKAIMAVFEKIDQLQI